MGSTPDRRNLLFAMGLVALFAPGHARVAGAIGVILSLVSGITALGGFGIGMFLGIIGSSSLIAWHSGQKISNRLVFWSVFGVSMVLMLSMVILVMGGMLAVATPMAGPFTASIRRIECHTNRTVTTFSRIDHRTPVLLFSSDVCTLSGIVLTRHVLGITVTTTEASVTQKGVMTEASSVRVGREQDVNLVATNVGETSDVSVQTDVTLQILFQSTQSLTIQGISASLSSW